MLISALRPSLLYSLSTVSTKALEFLIALVEIARGRFIKEKQRAMVKPSTHLRRT